MKKASDLDIELRRNGIMQTDVTEEVRNRGIKCDKSVTSNAISYTGMQPKHEAIRKIAWEMIEERKKQHGKRKTVFP